MDYILPPALFADLPTFLLLILVAVGLALLVKGADWLVESAVGLAQRLGMPKVIIGATVVSLGTTTPETAVSVMAAFQGLPDLALGNAVGSVTCNTALIFGLCSMLAPIPADRFVLRRHGVLLLGVASMLIVVSLMFHDDGQRILPRFIGVLFVVLLGAYLWISMIWARKHPSLQPAMMGRTEEEIEKQEAGRPVAVEALWLVIGLIFVVFGSHILIRSIEALCVRWGVPQAILAATLIAFGTSLPELITAVASLIKGHPELLVGNIIGANILNVLFVTGAAACAAPLIVDPLFLKLHYPAMMVVLALFIGNGLTARKSFSRWPGVVLFIAYVAYIVANMKLGLVG